jgi:thymidylate synthase
MVMKDRGQDIFSYEAEDFAFEAYDPHPHISAPVAV